jgi:hypothetical protein
MDLAAERFAQFVCENESRFVWQSRSRLSCRAECPLAPLAKIAIARR